MDKKLLKILRQKRKDAYNDPQSILKKFDMFLEENGIYHSLNQELFFKSIVNKRHLCEFTLSMYFEAIYNNERLFLLDCLLSMGYDHNTLTEIVLNIFKTEEQNECLWEYADFLYGLKNYTYLDDYLNIIRDRKYGTSRGMLILLVGKSKKKHVVPILKELLNDITVYGYALDALRNFSGDEIDQIMRKYIDCKITWIRKIAKKYLSKK